VSILEDWDITIDELTEIAHSNPSLRGVMIGYIAEAKLKNMWFSDTNVEQVRKDNDHDRKKKGDLTIIYRGQTFRIESKSLQTAMCKKDGGIHRGKVQCDASDKRPVDLDDGSKVSTTCLKVGEFDILAANLFAFEGKWQFSFAKNTDLPRSNFKKYTEYQRQFLLATLVSVSWPPEGVFRDEPFGLLDELIEERSRVV
jgi:hypothetical protein